MNIAQDIAYRRYLVNMKKFPMLNVICQLLIALTVGVLEKICVLIYLLLPIGLFMLIMGFRTKNHKATAIGTFTNDRSEFQHIFPNFILVTVEPKLLQKTLNDKLQQLDKFMEKYKTVLILLVIGTLMALSIWLWYFTSVFHNLIDKL